MEKPQDYHLKDQTAKLWFRMALMIFVNQKEDPMIVDPTDAEDKLTLI